MHLQKIHETYPEDAVQVVFVISAAGDYVRANYFPSFKQDFKVDYTGLDNARDDVVRRYGLKTDSRTAKNIIVDRDGVIRMVGEFTPREHMEAVLDTLLGKKENVDLATSAAALKALAGGGEYARWKAARALGAMSDRAAVAPLITALGWAYVRSNDADNALATFGKVFASDASFQSSWDGVAELAKSPAGRKNVARFCSDMEAKFPGNDQVKSRTAEIRAALAKAN